MLVLWNRAKAFWRESDYLDLWLGAMFILLPLVHYKPSRHYNFKIALMELAVVAVFAIRYRWRTVDLSGVDKKYVGLFVIFVAWIFFTVFFADHQRYAFNRNFSVVAYIVFGYAVWRYLLLREHRRCYVAYLVSLSFLGPALGIAVYALMLESPATPDWRNPPFYSNIRHLGYHAAAASVFAFLIFNQASSAWRKVFAGLWLLVTVAYLVWSGSRGSIVALVFGGFALPLLIPRFRTRTVALKIAIVLALIATPLLLNIEISGYGMVKRTLTANSLDSFLGGRVTLWSRTVDEAGDWWLGIGGDNFIKLDASGRYTQAHNVVLQALLDWGVIGALGFMILLAATVVGAIANVRRMRDSDSTTVAALGLLISYLALSMVDGVFYHAVPFTLFVVAAAVVFSYRDTVPISARDAELRRG